MLIHIYVKPIKRLLQALYAVGLAGGLYLMATQVNMMFLDNAAWTHGLHSYFSRPASINCQSSATEQALLDRHARVADLR